MLRLSHATEKSAKIRRGKCSFWQNPVIDGFSKASFSGVAVMTEEEARPQ